MTRAAKVGAYGKILASYRGSGQLHFARGAPLRCRFHAVQLSDGRIVVNCSGRGVGRWYRRFDERMEAVDRLDGQSAEGAPVTISGLLSTGLSLRKRRAPSRDTWNLTCLANELDVAYADSGTPRSVNFGIVNFEYLGNSWRLTATGRSLETLSLSLPVGEQSIQKIADDEAVLAATKAQRGIDVTCYATIPLGDGVSLQDAVEAISDVCGLLSFAQGTKINWLYYEQLDGEARKVSLAHRDRVTKPFSPTPLIHPREPDDTARFVEQCFHTYRQDSTFDLGRLSDGYIDARGQGFLESKALVACALLDFLVGRYRGTSRAHTTLPKAVFKELAAELTLTAQGFQPRLSDPLHRARLTDICSRLGELNRPPLRITLEDFCESLSLNMPSQEIARVVGIRNSLIHRVRFLDDAENSAQYFQLLNFLDRILLKILGYDGYYIDCTTSPWKRVQI